MSGRSKKTRRGRVGVRVIRREAGRMRTLVESLLALTRGDEGARLEVGRHDLAPSRKKRRRLQGTPPKGRCPSSTSPRSTRSGPLSTGTRVLQAASILLDNAVKYTPEGGSVAVRLREEDGRVALEVSDTGVGIPEDQLPLVFERFHRTDPSRADGGAGLGLSIARQIAESHGGEIRAKSAPAKARRSRSSSPAPDRSARPAPSCQTNFYSFAIHRRLFV